MTRSESIFPFKTGIFFKTYRHVNRYRQILAVLIKYGFGDLVSKLNIGRYLDIGIRIVSGRRRPQLETLTRAERIRLGFEELGPTFTKMGQILSTRPDLIPAEFIQEFTKLQDSIPPFPFDQVREIILAELGSPIEDLFIHFEEEPLAAASIGQVHRARLRTGEPVVIKIQRPGIRDTVQIDIEILLHLAQLIERHFEEAEIYRPTRIVKEFARILELEMDFTTEAYYMERFAREFAGNPNLYVPKVYRAYSTGRVITMEYVEGIKVTDVEAIERAGLDRKIIASRGADLMLEQVFKHGFFHADPHPGNIFVLPENIICYFDFGMMGTLDRRSREVFVDLIEAYVSKNESNAAGAILKIVEQEQAPDRRALERDVLEFMEKHLYRPLKETRMKDLLHALIGVLNRNRLVLPPDMYLMIKTISEIEGVGLMLDPDFDITEKARPFIRRIKLERLEPSRIWAEVTDAGEEAVRSLAALPGEAREVLKQIRQGKAKIGFEHRGLEKLVFELDRSSNRIAFALIISSLIIGSSLVITTEVGPYLFGYPILGVLGFSFAGIFGIWLVVAIFRSGKL